MFGKPTRGCRGIKHTRPTKTATLETLVFSLGLRLLSCCLGSTESTCPSLLQGLQAASCLGCERPSSSPAARARFTSVSNEPVKWQGLRGEFNDIKFAGDERVDNLVS